MNMAIEQVLTVLTIVILSTCLLCKLNKKVYYHVKVLSLYFWYLIVGAFTIPFVIWKPGDVKRNMKWMIFCAKFLGTNWIFGVSIKEINGREYLDSPEPCVFVCNHQSEADQLAVLSLWPENCVMMAKSSIKYAGSFGIASLLCGVHFVERFRPEKAKKITEATTKRIKEEKIKLWVYPEGTRTIKKNQDQDLLPFKKGAFHTAVDAQVPIVPVVMSSYKHVFNPWEPRFDKCDLTVTVLPPISTKGKTKEDVSQLAEYAREEMLKVFRKTIVHVEANGNTKS